MALLGLLENAAGAVMRALGLGELFARRAARREERQVGAEIQRGKYAEAEAEERRRDQAVQARPMEVRDASDRARELSGRSDEDA